ncbi:MAG TPA: glycoside hydrolase family 5 protein [Dongiaceae bacterium]|nr:glycoside hydrolase family 5 protein [Dongiaceae bacterium]
MKTLLSVLLLSLVPVLAAPAEPFTPANPPEMQRLTNRHSPAFRAAKNFQHGVNLGNYLEAPPGQDWGVTCQAGEFAQMREAGFDHVRVPVGWHHYAGPAPDYKLKPEIFARVDFVVTNALAAKLAVLINIHHFNEFDQDPAGNADEFVAIWRQVAAYYAKSPAQLAFELDNEPHDKATTAAVNPVYARSIAAIRQTNPHRTIFVEPGIWGNIGELKNLVLPPDDNVIVSVHCYDPFYFTHQGATWTGDDTKVTGIQFPGPPAQPLHPDPALKIHPWVAKWIEEYNTLPADKNPSSPVAFTDKLKYAHDWSAYYGRPIHVGEFGCFTTADPKSRANFYSSFRREAEKLQLGWAMWDWSAGFRYWDKQTNAAMPGMHEALFGK